MKRQIWALAKGVEPLASRILTVFFLDSHSHLVQNPIIVEGMTWLKHPRHRHRQRVRLRNRRGCSTACVRPAVSAITAFAPRNGDARIHSRGPACQIGETRRHPFPTAFFRYPSSRRWL